MKLDEAIKYCEQDAGQKDVKDPADFDIDAFIKRFEDLEIAMEVILQAAKNWQTLVDARKDATAGEWEYLDWKEQRNRGIDDAAYSEDLPIFSSGKEVIMSFGNTETYYPTAGEEPSDVDANFIVLAANLTEKDTER